MKLVSLQVLSQPLNTERSTEEYPTLGDYVNKPLIIGANFLRTRYTTSKNSDI